MKTRGFILSFLLIVLFTNTAYAQDMRRETGNVDIIFSGATARCIVEIIGKSSDKIVATIELRCGDQNIKTWNKSSTYGYLALDDTVDVTKGKTYELVVEYTINGKAQQSFSDSGTC